MHKKIARTESRKPDTDAHACPENRAKGNGQLGQNERCGHGIGIKRARTAKLEEPRIERPAGNRIHRHQACTGERVIGVPSRAGKQRRPNI
jgi:hypothetical protein